MIVAFKRTKYNIVDPHRYKRYFCRDGQCIGCLCFQPGTARIDYHDLPFYDRLSWYSVRIKPEPSVCLTMHYSGCPDDTGFSEERFKEFFLDGWRTAPL